MAKEVSGYLVEKPDDEEPGNLVLFLNRGGGLFGGGGSSQIFIVDSVTAGDTMTVATRRDGSQIFLSKDSSFVAVPRPMTKALTVEEMAERQKADDKRWNEAFKDAEAEAEEEARKNLPLPGNYI